MFYDTFKEARKAAREYKRGRFYICKIKKGKLKNKFLMSRELFPDAEFIINCKDGRVCKISNLIEENALWNRHPEMHGKAFPFRYKVRNRKPDEDKSKYLKDMSIQGKFKYDYE